MTRSVDPLVDALAAQLVDLEGRVRASTPDDLEELVATALTELAAAVEELRVAGEELEHQRDELLRTQQAVTEERARYQALFDEAPDGYLVTTGDGRILEANLAASRLLGATRTTLSGTTLMAHVGDEDRRALYRTMATVRHGPVQLLVTIHPTQGGAFPAALHVAQERSAARFRDGRLRWLIRDVTDDDRREQALREAVHQLEHADEMRRAFTLGIAHDLRGPVGAIMALVDTTPVEVATAAHLRSVLTQVGTNARVLRRIQTDLLDLERLGRDVVQPFRRTTDLAVLVEEVVKEVDPGPRHVVVAAEAVTASVDPGMVRGMVAKLVDNAASCTEPDARIEVRIEPTGDEVVIRVDDDGPGVPPADRERIFELFTRGGDGGRPGLGAGLYLVRRFAELHGGRAWVEERAGGGASFRVALPAG